jgi:hypothetical protein
MSTPRRQTLENRAERLGLTLSYAGRQSRMEASSNNEPMPRWELSDGKNASTIRAYLTLEEVSFALDNE